MHSNTVFANFWNSHRPKFGLPTLKFKRMHEWINFEAKLFTQLGILWNFCFLSVCSKSIFDISDVLPNHPNNTNGRPVEYLLVGVRRTLLIRLQKFFILPPLQKESKWIRNRFKIFINTRSCSCLRSRCVSQDKFRIIRRVLHARKSELGALCINRMIIRHGRKNKKGLLKRDLREKFVIGTAWTVRSGQSGRMDRPSGEFGEPWLGLGGKNTHVIEYRLCGMLCRLSKLLAPRVI